MKNNLVISDANIFFDIIDSGLIKEFFSLPFDIRTTMLVLNEITDTRQLQAVKPFIDSDKLKVEQVSDELFAKSLMLSLTTPGDLSISDCAVWQVAKNNNAALLTGDGRLRKAAEKDNVEVHGILYIFDEMVNNSVNKTKVINAVSYLINTNKRFPKKQAEDKIKQWKSIKTNKMPVSISENIEGSISD